MFILFRTVLQVLHVLFLIIFVLTFSLLMLVIFLICVFREFNINFDNHSHPLYFNINFVLNYLLFSLTQVVVGPTHVHHDSSISTIDLVFAPDTFLVNSYSSTVRLWHYGIILELNRKPKQAAKAKGWLIWRYSHADWNTECQLIDNFNWDSIMSDDIELSWKQWPQQFMCISYVANNTQQASTIKKNSSNEKEKPTI